MCTGSTTRTQATIRNSQGLVNADESPGYQLHGGHPIASDAGTGTTESPVKTVDTAARGIDADAFRRIFGAFPTGVTVITCRDVAGNPIGLTATAVASVSLSPPQLLVCLDNRKYTLHAIRETGRFVVNFLHGSQTEVASRFASHQPEKFIGLDWFAGHASKAPILAGALAHAECEVHKVVPSGDHVIVIGSIIGGAAFDGSALLYHAGRYGCSPNGHELAAIAGAVEQNPRRAAC